MNESLGSFQKQWLLPVVVLTTVSLLVFWGFYSLDHFATGGDAVPPFPTPVGRYLHFDPQSITDAVSSLAGMIAAVYGIMITVVSIIVQLSPGQHVRHQLPDCNRHSLYR